VVARHAFHLHTVKGTPGSVGSVIFTDELIGDRRVGASWFTCHQRVSNLTRLGGVDVRFGSFADITTRSRHVRFTPDNGHSSVQV
jgi:hypothetical protein